MNLETLLDATRKESAARKDHDSLKSLKLKVRDQEPPRGFAKRVAAHPFSLIAEVKMKSPSMGNMSGLLGGQIAEVHKIYDRHPAVTAISVLTQETHFGGTPAALRKIRRETRKPVLRKDFILDAYEVYYSRMIGADAILLMANVITEKAQFRELYDLATSLGMDVLCEIHFEEELELLPPSPKLVGINSRNFTSDKRFGFSKFTRHVGKDTTTDLAAFDLFSKLPEGALKVAESGLNAKNIAEVLSRYPFNAALVGTSLLRDGARYAEEELNRFHDAALQTAPQTAKSAVHVA
jgi:indole-3-glycerol phosphate synthase